MIFPARIFTPRFNHDGTRIVREGYVVSTQETGRRWFTVGQGISGYLAGQYPIEALLHAKQESFEVVLNFGHLAVTADSPQAKWDDKLISAYLKNERHAAPFVIGLPSLQMALQVAETLSDALDSVFLKELRENGPQTDTAFLKDKYETRLSVRELITEAAFDRIHEILGLSGNEETLTIDGVPALAVPCVLQKETATNRAYMEYTTAITLAGPPCGLFAVPVTVNATVNGVPKGEAMFQTHELVHHSDPDAGMLIYGDLRKLLSIAAAMAYMELQVGSSLPLHAFAATAVPRFVVKLTSESLMQDIHTKMLVYAAIARTFSELPEDAKGYLAPAGSNQRTLITAATARLMNFMKGAVPVFPALSTYAGHAVDSHHATAMRKALAENKLQSQTSLTETSAELQMLVVQARDAAKSLDNLNPSIQKVGVTAEQAAINLSRFFNPSNFKNKQ